MTAPHRRQALHPLRIAFMGLGFLLAAGAARAEEVTLKAAVFVPPTSTYGLQFKRFVDRVNETGKGTLQIRIAVRRRSRPTARRRRSKPAFSTSRPFHPPTTRA